MTDKPTVFAALSAVMADVQAVKKSDRNSQQNYNFRGIDAVVNAVGPKLREYGVICVPIGVATTYRDVLTTTGKPSRECTVTARYRFYGPAGDFIDTEVPGEAMDSGDKGTPKAMSVAYRTLLLQALCIPTDEADPDSQSYQRDVDIEATRRADRKSAEQVRNEPDPFQTPVVTDAAWMEGFRARLTACTKPSEVRGLDEEAHVQYADRKLTADDAKALKAEIDARLQELTGALV